MLAALGAAALVVAAQPAAATPPDPDDPRSSLSAGEFNAGTAAVGIDLLSTQPKTGFFAGPGQYNSDLAFTGDYAVAGSYGGFQIFDVSDPSAPTLEKSFVCPGGQGDVSVYGDLLFMSVESGPGRIDCGTQTTPTTDPQSFRGLRVFDISDLMNPVQVAAVQTCRGSHTHTVVEDLDDPDNVYVYVSGTAGVRSAAVLPGCSNGGPTTENPSQWRIEVVKVPIATPETAAIVNGPRLFANPETGAINGLQNGPTQPRHPSGGSYSPSPNTNTCHDITAYPEIGLAAGACQGNGILIDISDPANPVRLDAVADPNYAYWHSATFNNDGTKVVFTDEWGGGSAARCRATDQLEWGANSIYDIVDGKLEFRSYYKLPAAQTATENCVAHNGTLVPVPGRDIMVQAWYQGGVSVFDFTDSANPTEIAYFDRGPISATSAVLGGYWSVYWYNGTLVGNEIHRGFDTLALTPTDDLSANEIAAAAEFSLDEVNAQGQVAYTNAASFAVAGAYIDQAERSGALAGATLTKVRGFVDRAAVLAGEGKTAQAAAVLELGARAAGSAADAAGAIRDLAASFGVPADTTKPVTELVTPGGSVFDGNAVQLTVNATDDVALDRVVGNLYQNGALLKSTQVAANGENAQSHTVDLATVVGGGLPLGDYVLRYNAQDVAGNISQTKEFAFTLTDRVKPEVVLVKPTTAGPFQALTVQVDATDNWGLNRVVANIYQGSTLVKSTQTPANGAKSASHSATVQLPDGTYTIKYNAGDLLGNVSKTSTHQFTIDTTAPTVTVKTGANETVGANGAYSLVSFKLHDAGKIDKLTLNGVEKNLTDNAWSDLNFVKPGAFGGVAGENTLVVYDVAGNATTLTFTLN